MKQAIVVWVSIGIGYTIGNMQTKIGPQGVQGIQGPAGPAGVMGPQGGEILRGEFKDVPEKAKGIFDN